MWFLLVTTVAGVFADTSYLYNAPNALLRLPSNTPANSYSSYNYQQYHDNRGGEIKSDTYLRKDYVNNYNGFGNPSYITTHSNNGAAGYNQPFTPLNPINSNYAQDNWQHAVPPLRVDAHSDYIEPPPLPTNANIHLNSGASASNSHSSPSFGLNQNSEYTQTFTAPGNNNYNNAYSNSYTSQPIGQKNLNNNFIDTVGTYNNGFRQPLKIISNGSANNGYSQSVQISGSLTGTNGRSKISSFGVNNIGYAHGFTPSLSSSNNGYTETAPASAINELSSSYGQTLTPPASVTVNNGYKESLTKSGSNLKAGYEQSLPSSAVNGGYLSNEILNANNSTNNGYSLPPSGPTHIDLNSDLIASAASDSLNTGLVHKSLESVVNTSPTISGTSNPGVAPIIHKHIYFHVPPPEIEEPVKTINSGLLAKKNYKILFIKMPSQEPKSNLVQLQEQMRNAAIEDRTIIYVLVKKPEEPKPVVLPESKPSDHQVFFVKYNDSPFDIAARVNEELDKTGSINSIVPLEPGLVNGRHK